MTNQHQRVKIVLEMSSNRWDKNKLYQLYIVEGKTLQEIGDAFGVTRERVRQKMESFGIERGYHKSPKWFRKRAYQSLEEYLENAQNRNGDNSYILRRFISAGVCSECGRTDAKFHLHHIIYPISSINDIQILCPSCHAIKHRNGVTYASQIDLYNLYLMGIATKELAKKYKIKRITVYKIIEKIRRRGKGIQGQPINY